VIDPRSHGRQQGTTGIELILWRALKDHRLASKRSAGVMSTEVLPTLAR